MADFGVTVTVSGFSSLARKIDSSYQEIASKIAADLQTELKKKTPVRTGHAQAGWHTEKKGKDIAVVNNVPYVPYLDKGTSKMKPANRGQGIIGPSLQSIKGKTYK